MGHAFFGQFQVKPLHHTATPVSFQQIGEICCTKYWNTAILARHLGRSIGNCDLYNCVQILYYYIMDIQELKNVFRSSFYVYMFENK